MTQSQTNTMTSADACQRALMLWGKQHDAVRREHDAWELNFSAQAALIYRRQGGAMASGFSRDLVLEADMIEQTERLASMLLDLAQKMRAYEQLSTEG